MTTARTRRLGGALLLGLAALSHEALSRPAPPAEPTRKEIGKNVFFEVHGKQRRVIVRAAVCLREGQLEGLLCRKGTKEHEYVLAADADARHIHAALLAAGATPGSPVRFRPKYAPASGTTIRVSLQYQKDGKTVTLPARQWVRVAKEKKDLDRDWVFGGSVFVRDPEDKNKPPVYLANRGDVICVCNMDTAMLDLPVRSPKKFDERAFHAHTERIPATGTAVEVVFEPVLAKKDKEK